MENKKVQITVAYVYHAISILLGILLMRHYAGIFWTVCAVADILYLIYWIVLNRKGYMSWIVYLHFVIGTVIELFFHVSEIIPIYEGGFISGVVNGFCILLLLFHAIAVGAANLILCSIDKRRHNNGH